VDKKIAIAVWALALALANILLFALAQSMTPTFWITLAFIWAAFISSLIFQWRMLEISKTPDDGFLHIPALVISLIYELIQIPMAIIFVLGSAVIPWKAALLIQGALLIVAWTVALLGLGGNEHITKVNSRQKDHHAEI